MNRAIGAIGKTAGVNSFGMFYQWGRKDPFTPATTTSPANGNPGGKDTQLYNATGNPINTNTYGIGGEWTAVSSAASNITILTSNTSKFYGISSPYVPIASADPTLKNDWWNPTAKTLYDPCPSGYRIPPYNTYSGFPLLSGGGLTAGATWKDSFFPASGYRNESNDQFGNIGGRGGYWLASWNNADNGYDLAFNTAGAYPNHINRRSLGFPVRCISE